MLEGCVGMLWMSMSLCGMKLLIEFIIIPI